jgi:hypothetical protein
LPIERPTTTARPAPTTTEVEAPLPIYGAPARPFEFPVDNVPAANTPEGYLPPPAAGRAGREFGGNGSKKVLKRRGRKVQVRPDFVKEVERRIGQAQLISFKIEPVRRNKVPNKL